MADHDEASDDGRPACAHLHLRWGWWSLLFFLGLGAALEALHGFKAGWYLDVGNETRRLMWTLAHTHGTLFALVNIAFALTLRSFPTSLRKYRRLASRSLLGASVLLPGGFLLGGIAIGSADPGPAVLLVPVGAALLLLAVLLTALDLGERRGPTS
jgi:hypothetical protein